MSSESQSATTATATTSSSSTTTPPSGSSGHHSSHHHHHHSTSSSSGGSSRTSTSTWFTAEIQQMMHGFGDCRKPLLESAMLIEDIVHQQMIRLLEMSEDVARQRSARFIGIEDYLFLLRRDKIKLRRLIRYMDVRDIKSAALKGVSAESRPDQEEEATEQETKQPMKKRRKICYEFLSAIDQTGELLALLDDTNSDEIKQDRALRAELQTRHMDTQQYKEYCEARQASFTPRYKTQKFKDWLMQGVTLDIKPNPLAVEVLSYLAYETVAQVVDLALLVKRDARAVVDDPFSQLMPPVCINHDSLPAFVGAASSSSAGGGGPALKSPTSRTTSPTAQSPPSTPTTPTPASTPTQTSPALASTSSTKSKNKKKKKSGNPPSRDIYSSQAVQCRDIREAMRRYSQCIGPFADFSKAPMNPGRHRLLCA